jgi:3-phosphoshikimate 1-carboxyvinyltransferase
LRIEPAASLVGHVGVPGDKSISHRAVLIGALGEGETRVHGFGRAGDTQATVDGVRTLGVEVEDDADDELVVHGVGLRELRAGTVDCRNSGTLMRLLAGVVAGQEGEFVLTGDESLSTRPMERIAAPLRQMGASVDTTAGHAPLVIRGSAALRGIEVEPEVASAQVKSAILLAGLNADGCRAHPHPRPHRAHARGGRRTGPAQFELGHGGAGGCAPPRRDRGAGRLLVRRTAARRRGPRAR